MFDYYFKTYKWFIHDENFPTFKGIYKVTDDICRKCYAELPDFKFDPASELYLSSCRSCHTRFRIDKEDL